MAAKLTLKRRHVWIVKYGSKRRGPIREKHFDSKEAAEQFSKDFLALGDRWTPLFTSINYAVFTS